MAREIPQYVSQLSMGSLPKVQFSNAQAEATQAVSQQLQGLSLDIQEKDMKIEKIRATTELQTTLDRQYQEFGNDPGKLEQAQRAFKSGFIKTIKNPDLAAEFEAGYDSIAAPYLNKSVNIYKDNQDDALKLSIIQAAEVEIASAEAIADGIVSDVPEHQQGAEVALGRGLSRLSEYRNAKKHDGTNLFSPEEISSMELRVTKAIQKKAKALQVAPLEKQLWSDSPEQLAQDIANGKYANSGISEKDLDEYAKKAVARREDLDKREFYLGGLNMLSSNQAMLEAFKKKDPKLMTMIEDGLENGTLDPLAANYMRERFIKANPVTPEEQAKVTRDLLNRTMEINTKFAKDKKSVTYEDAAKLMLDIQRADARGVEALRPFITKLAPITLELANNERGRDDLNDNWIFPDADERYDAAYEVVNKYLVDNEMEDNASLRESLLSSFIRRMDALPEDIKKEQTKLDAIATEEIRKVIDTHKTRVTGYSEATGGIPNAEIKDDGTVNPVSMDSKSTMKADTKIDDIQIKRMKDQKTGVEALVHFRDGKVTKTQILDKQGNVVEEILP